MEFEGTNPSDISTIIRKWKQGNTREYDVLISQIADPEITVSKKFHLRENLLQILKGLKKCIVELGKEYEVLVGVILNINWTQLDPKVIKEYQSFLLNLVSANPFYLRACLRMILKSFVPGVKLKQGEEITVEQKQSDDLSFLHLHNLLQAVQHLVPMTSTVLGALLLECQPFMQHSSYHQECHARNLLHLTQYMPALRMKVLEILVARMTKFDVRASRQDIADAECADDEADEEEDSDMEQGIFQMEGVECTPEPTTLKTPAPMAHPEGDKLDKLMNIVLSYIYAVCYPSGELDWESTKKLYRELLAVFDKFLLPTHGSCHVQFIMFFICSFREPLLEGFLDYLWKKVQDPNTQVVFRQAAVSYIASLLARAKYIPTSTVKACLELMVSWIHAYISTTADSSSQADVAHHGPFYSVCQAVFYVFIFRHKELLAMKKGLRFCQGLNLQTVATCRLNPLRFCLSIVAKTFASITRMHQLAFCDTVLERNRRSLLPAAMSAAGKNSHLTQQNPLDSFFPFDPYVLVRSRQHIGHLYQEYDGAPVEEEEKIEEEEESHYTDFDQSVPDTGAEAMFSVSAGKTPNNDFLMYGTSPGFKHT